MKFYVKANDETSIWPSEDEWYYFAEDDERFESAWGRYLSSPEDVVNQELQIFPEPSIQGYSGGVFIHDESGQDRTENGYPWYQGWQSWCEWEIDAAASSKNASEYQEKYREHIRKLCGI